MAQPTLSLIDASAENRMRFACSVINKLARKGVVTDAIVAAATTGVQDLIDRIAATIGSNPQLYDETEKILVRHLIAEVKWASHTKIGILTDTIANNLLTIRGTAAGTDLRYCFSNQITDQNFDPANESFVEAVFSDVFYSSSLV